MIGKITSEGFEQALMQCAATTLLVIPWLYSPGFGPSPQLVQWLITASSLACYVICTIFGRWRQDILRRQVATAWIIAACVSTAMAVVQYFGWSEALSPWVSVTHAGEAYANLRQRNQFATLTMIGLAALPFWQKEVPEKLGQSLINQRQANVASLTLAALLGIGNFVSSSRTGGMQLLLLIVLFWQWERRRGAERSSTKVFLTAALAYILAGLVMPLLAGLNPAQSGLLGRMQEASNICVSRMVLWENVAELIAQKPWFGWGVGELKYAHFITLYSGPRFCDILGNAHNLPLHIAVELGIPLSLLFCGLTLWWLVRARPWQLGSKSQEMAWGVLIVIGLHSMLEYPLWYGPYQLATLLAIWLLWEGKIVLIQMGHIVTVPLRLKVAICFILIFSCAYWDYWRVSQIYLPSQQRAHMYREDTLEKVSNSWFFQDQVKFAALSITSVDSENAKQIHSLALEMLHFSPEASVVQKLIESADLLGYDEEVRYFSKRFQVAFPEEFANWRKLH